MAEGVVYGMFPGGRLQLVLMQHPPPSYLSKLAGGGAVGAGGGGRREDRGGIGSLAGGAGAARNPLLSHAYLKGVSGGMGGKRYVWDNSNILSLPGRKS